MIQILKLLAFILNKLPESDWKPIPLCALYYKYNLEIPNLVGHVTAPSVTTNAATNITHQDFDMGGNITDTNNENASVRGFCYVVGAGGTPTTSDSVVNESGSFGTGLYQLNISGLAANTTYSVRAYATNSAGTGYGSTVEVTTLPDTPPNVYTVSPLSTPIASYDSSNVDSGQIVGNTGTSEQRAAQSFTGDGSSIKYVRLWLKKTSASNNISARIYSDSSGVPGSLLATSDAIAPTAIVSTYSWVDFEFSTPYATSASTTYWLVLLDAGSGESLQWGYDGSSPTGSGNAASYIGISGSWTALTGRDHAFAIYDDSVPSDSDTTPTLSFLGVDHENRDIRYNIQIGTDNSFATSGSSAADSYSASQNVYFRGSTTDHAFGQSFSGDGKELHSVLFRLRKNGSPPSSTLQAVLYRHKGTFGTNSQPTGGPIAVSSTTFSEADISTSIANYTFNFDGIHKLDSSTKYCIALRFSVSSAYSASNNISVYGGTTLTHAGNVFYEDGAGWKSYSNYEIYFTVNTADRVLDKVSGTDSGFSGSPDNTDPFATDQQVDYTIQSSEKLSNGTYYWRVRGIDPSGSNTYGDWSPPRSFTVESTTLSTQDIAHSLTLDNTTVVETGGSATIVTQDISHSFTLDNTTITQNHVIATNDIEHGLTLDATTINQNHVLASADIEHGLTLDNTTIQETHILTVQDIEHGLTLDSTTITQNHVITPDDIVFSLTEDNTDISQNHVLVTQDIEHGLTLDNTTITQNHVVASDDIEHGLTTDNTTITQNHIIVTQDIEHGLTVDTTTINQNHVLASTDIEHGLTLDNTTVEEGVITLIAQDIEHSFTLDNTTVDHNHVLPVQDIEHSLTVDATTINQNHVIATDDIVFNLTEDNTTVDVNHIVETQDIAHSFTVDTTTISQNHVIATQDIEHSLTEDNTTIDVNHIIEAQDIEHSFTVDATTITQNHVITPDDIAFNLTEDSTTIDVNHIIETQDIEHSLTTDNTTITQNHVIATQDIEHGLTLDNTTIDLSVILPMQDIEHSLTLDNTTISQNHVIATDDIVFNLTEDNGDITQNHIIETQDIEHGLTVDATTISQNHVIASNDIEFTITEDNTTLDINHVIETQDITLTDIIDANTISQNHVIAVQDISHSLTEDNTTVTQQDAVIAPDDISFGGSLPRIMFDVDGGAYYRLDNNLLIKL